MKTGIFPPDTFRKLERLYEDRQVADYDWNLVVDRESAEQNLIDAEWLVKACREYIKRRMERWEG